MSSTTAEYRITGIAVTTTAKSKAFRLHAEQELRRRLRTLSGTLSQKGGAEAAEFHLVAGDRAIVFTVEQETAVVITQMHSHPDYANQAEYHQISPGRFDIQIP